MRAPTKCPLKRTTAVLLAALGVVCLAAAYHDAFVRLFFDGITLVDLLAGLTLLVFGVFLLISE